MIDDTSKPFEGPTPDPRDGTEADPSLKRAMDELPLDIPDFSHNVINRLQEDMSSPLPCQYDFEFISSYFDGELSCEFNDPKLLQHRIETFEQHLPQCSPCNQHLGHLLEVSTVYHSHLYRLEDSLAPFDISRKVMALHTQPDFVLDEAVALPQMGCGRFPVDSLSAHVDNELESDEAKTLVAHLAACSDCQEVYTSLGQINRLILDGQARLLEQEEVIPTLDIWSRIQWQLQPEPLGKTSVTPAIRHQKRRLMRGISVAIAASVLVVVFAGRFIPHSQPQVAQKPVDTVALQAALVADENDAAKQQSQTQPVVNVVYETPESYLFSSDTDFLPDADMDDKKDVSAIVLNNE